MSPFLFNLCNAVNRYSNSTLLPHAKEHHFLKWITGKTNIINRIVLFWKLTRDNLYLIFTKLKNLNICSFHLLSWEKWSLYFLSRSTLTSQKYPFHCVHFKPFTQTHCEQGISDSHSFNFINRLHCQ